MNKLANLDYSIIANRTNKTVNFSNKACRKIYSFLHSRNKHISNKNYVRIWRTLVVIGTSSNFNMTILLCTNFINNNKKKSHKKYRRKKLHCYIIKKLSMQQWKEFILYVLKLVGISEYEITERRNKSVKNAKRFGILHKDYKYAIRFFNLYKVEQSFFDDKTAMVLTRWQIQRIALCTSVVDNLQSIKKMPKGYISSNKELTLGDMVIDLFNGLYGLMNENPIMPNNLLTKNINHYCGTHFTINQFKFGKPYINTTKEISKLKSGIQWYQIFMILLKNQYPVSDYNYIAHTLNGDKSLYHQFKHQVSYLESLEDQGVPIKGPYGWFYSYDSDRSDIKLNPARVFYHYNENRRKKEIKQAVAFAKANHIWEAIENA